MRALGNYIRAVGVLLLAGGIPVGLNAQEMDLSEQDAAYEICINEFLSRNMGTTNQAAAFCYDRVYQYEGQDYVVADPNKGNYKPH